MMSRIRGLELLFSLVKTQLRSKEDCVVAALHCLLINENLQCTGTGEEFTDSDTRTELLPSEWNVNQEVYTLRYTSKDKNKRLLVKIVKAGHILHVNIVENEDATAAMSVNVNNHIADDYSEYSSTYLELDSLSASFQRDISKVLINPSKEPSKPTEAKKHLPKTGPSGPAIRRPVPAVGFDEPLDFPNIGGGPFPSIGGQDLDPLGRGHGGMIMDPHDFGVPARPNRPPFGLPRGAVPPGARFDPFGPPIRGPNRGHPSPGDFRQPDFDDFM